MDVLKINDDDDDDDVAYKNVSTWNDWIKSSFIHLHHQIGRALGNQMTDSGVASPRKVGGSEPCFFAGEQ